MTARRTSQRNGSAADLGFVTSRVVSAEREGSFPHPHRQGLAAPHRQVNSVQNLLTSEGLMQVRNGDNWLILDTWKEPGRKFNEGKFVFLPQGGDQIGLSDFEFVPR